MKFALLIHENDGAYGVDGNPTKEEMAARHYAFAGSLGATLVHGAGLKPSHTATTLRGARDGGRAIHDGPFAETKEQLGGFYILDVADLDAALAVARRMPLLPTGAVEVRPLLDGD